ncbi:hypothetical protein [Nonomuraea gerenzanensis]|uniref:Lipoprotein n=1 Tax=Nonomuraea gerenzanensis TaxID=93944 RepID=A0A1M4EFG5_9ACTN|nr:hypothetical protein [Nonomuraea gerenzanensis]UBU09158.1 hypothetical protein LCN96_32860 [Nonomuraea gerenzanensis]SBO97550.1 hypothetical protein BN4615_P7066 [Nonomuraea gerenzanensis]
MIRKLVTATTTAGLLATAMVTFGGTAAGAASCTGSCIEKSAAAAPSVARQFPWEASGAPISPDGGYQPDGGYHND